MKDSIQEAQNLLTNLQETRSRLKTMMKCDNQHPFLYEINSQITSIRMLLNNWDDGKWEDLRFGRAINLEDNK